MSPLEGCPTVFQVICNLTPGYHQVNNLNFDLFRSNFFASSSLLENLSPYRLCYSHDTDQFSL